jgi:ABC-type multidrug transport system fused ATPase/permease subunit
MRPAVEDPAVPALSPSGQVVDYEQRVRSARSTQRTALLVDGVTVAASLAANVADAPATVPGRLIASTAPVGLFLIMFLWHRASEELEGWAGRFVVGVMALIGLAAASISFGHLHSIAAENGQVGYKALAVPLVIDGTAIVAAVIVFAMARKIRDLRTEAEASARVLAAAEAEAARAAAAQAAEAERAERERAEAVRLAEAEAQAETARAEAARLEAANRKAEQAERARERVSAARAGNGKAPRGAATEVAIADYLATHPESTQVAVAEAVGVSAKTISRSGAWAAHVEARRAAAPPETEASDEPPETVNELREVLA